MTYLPCYLLITASVLFFFYYNVKFSLVKGTILLLVLIYATFKL